MDIWVLKNACSKQETLFWPGISNDTCETVEKCGICQASSKAAKPVGNVSDVPPHAWHTLGTDLFCWNKIDYLVTGDYFSKYLIVRRLPNSSTHAVIKELGLVFTELGRPFILRSDNGPCYSSREFHNFLSFYQVDHITSSPHYPQSNGFAEALVGIAKKLMEKSVRDGKPWNYGLMQYRTTPISSILPSPLEMLTGRRPCSTLPQLPLSIGKNMETSRIRGELLRRQPNTSTGAHMDLDPGQPVFVKEVSGNVWKTTTVDQPATEPDSYWVRFPDNSILRRTRSMIKPRSLPSHLELQAEAQPWNFEGKTNSHSYDPFNQLNGNSMLPATPCIEAGLHLEELWYDSIWQKSYITWEPPLELQQQPLEAAREATSFLQLGWEQVKSKDVPCSDDWNNAFVMVVNKYI